MVMFVLEEQTMFLEVTEAEKQALLECMNVAVKASPNALVTAQQLLPLAMRISQLAPSTVPTAQPSAAADSVGAPGLSQ